MPGESHESFQIVRLCRRSILTGALLNLLVTGLAIAMEPQVHMLWPAVPPGPPTQVSGEETADTATACVKQTRRSRPGLAARRHGCRRMGLRAKKGRARVQGDLYLRRENVLRRLDGWC